MIFFLFFFLCNFDVAKRCDVLIASISADAGELLTDADNERALVDPCDDEDVDASTDDELTKGYPLIFVRYNILTMSITNQ